MKLNAANKLTMLRVAMVPLFVLFMIVGDIPLNYLWAMIVFVLASITDYIDGQIARRQNMVTDFGKFLDPLADKVLVMAALVCFVELGWAYGWAIILILAREFMISGVRLLAAGRKDKVVIAADMMGKVKTAFTMIAIIIILCFNILPQLGVDVAGFHFDIITDVLILIATALTVISGVSYIVKNKGIFADTE